MRSNWIENEREREHWRLGLNRQSVNFKSTKYVRAWSHAIHISKIRMELDKMCVWVTSHHRRQILCLHCVYINRHVRRLEFVFSLFLCVCVCALFFSWMGSFVSVKQHTIIHKNWNSVASVRICCFMRASERVCLYVCMGESERDGCGYIYLFRLLCLCLCRVKCEDCSSPPNPSEIKNVQKRQQQQAHMQEQWKS